MLKSIYKVFSKNYLLNYSIFALLLFLFSGCYISVNSGHVRYVKEGFTFFLIFVATCILLSIAVDYIVLKIVKIRATLRMIHRDFAWIYMLEILTGFLIFVFLEDGFPAKIISVLIRGSLFAYQLYILAKLYAAPTKKCIGYGAFIICGNIIFGILNDRLK